MNLQEAYKTKKEDKIKTIYCRIDDTMYRELCIIRNELGISLSEIFRTGARRIIKEAKDKSEIKII